MRIGGRENGFSIIITVACELMRVIDGCRPRCTPSGLFLLTCSHSVLQGVPAVHQDLLQRFRLVGQLQVEALHAFQELVGVVEVQHLGGAVESLLDVGGEDINHLQQKLYGGLLSIFGWQQV